MSHPLTHRFLRSHQYVLSIQSSKSLQSLSMALHFHGNNPGSATIFLSLGDYCSLLIAPSASVFPLFQSSRNSTQNDLSKHKLDHVTYLLKTLQQLLPSHKAEEPLL